MSVDIGSAASRIYAGLADEFEALCFDAAKQVAPLVESEIELMLLGTFLVLTKTTVIKIEIGEQFKSDKTHILITPQLKWQGYRIDFCFRSHRNPERMIFVECDGHDFHERTKEQAEHDRAKDRAIQLAGIPILRFTGREIWRNPATVGVEIFNFMDKEYGK